MTQTPTYKENYRPQFHFTARENWLNDPNGCVFYAGEYHLFFQHNPAGREWGNMTWGHAVSPDLVHWRQLSHALHPYDNGTVFSGSAVLDAANLSGLGQGEQGPLVAAFTHARKPFGQAIAYSNDKGRSWSLYAGGKHVVPNQGLDEEERDPKVFWHAPTQKWIMVLWVRQNQARFFASDDLLLWQHTSDFVGEGLFECPDLIPLPLDGDRAAIKWLLCDAALNYWVGSFDGEQFVAEEGPLRGDWGNSFYAAQTWSNSGTRRVQIGWLRRGEYPGMPFNQQMSFPCALSLRQTAQGIRLCRTPVEEIENLRTASDTLSNHSLQAGERLSIGTADALFDIELTVETTASTGFKIQLYGQDITYHAGRIECLGKTARVAPRKGIISLRLLVDRTSIELFANAGEVCMSTCFLPDADLTTVQLRATNGDLKVRHLTVHRLTSAWR